MKATRLYRNLVKKLDKDIEDFLSCEETWWICESPKDVVLHLCPKPSNKGLYIEDKKSWVILLNVEYLRSKNMFCTVCRDQCPTSVIDIYQLRKTLDEPN